MNDAKRLLMLGALGSLLILYMTYTYAENQSANQPLILGILSERTLSGTAGDFATVNGEIKNSGSQPLNDITTYISLVDESNKMPVDLEDWSAERGLYIGTIDSGQTLPLNWKIHFVKAGKYSLIIVAEVAGQEIPQVSSILHFTVKPKHNLNPGFVLPVALGMPIVVLFIMLLLNYRRKL
jgi:hypothetical protein